MNEKNKSKIQPITDPNEVPEGLSDEDQIAFWETHAVTEEYLAKTEEVPPEERPEPRSPKTKPVSIRFADDTINRLKTLAEVKGGIGYQTLIKEFVDQRLYEEEKREGIIPGDAEQTFEEVIDYAFTRSFSDWSALPDPFTPTWSIMKAAAGSAFDAPSRIGINPMAAMKRPRSPIEKVVQAGNPLQQLARDARNSFFQALFPSPTILWSAQQERHGKTKRVES